MTIWKSGKNVLSLCIGKRGCAHWARPRFRIIDYQQLTLRVYVHIAPPACTSRKNSKYSRRSAAYSRGGKVPFRAEKVVSSRRRAKVCS